MTQLKPRDRVKLVTPDNPYLDGHIAIVYELTDYGAVVYTRVGTGQFRALLSEMVKLEHTNGHGKSSAKSIEQGYTGEMCDTCGEFKMKRVGTCLTCDTCGTTAGSCG